MAYSAAVYTLSLECLALNIKWGIDALTVTQLVVVLATLSILALIHLCVFIIRLLVAAQSLDKLEQRQRAFLDYIETYHQEKQMLPTLWIPPSTFQLLNQHGMVHAYKNLFCATECTMLSAIVPWLSLWFTEIKEDKDEHITEPCAHQDNYIETREEDEHVTEPQQSIIEERLCPCTSHPYTVCKHWIELCHPICSNTDTLQTRFDQALEQELQSERTKPQKDTTLTQWQSHYSTIVAEIEEVTVPIEIDSDGKVIVSEQNKLWQAKKTKRSRGNKKPSRHSKSKSRDGRETQEKRKKKMEGRLLTESSSDHFSA